MIGVGHSIVEGGNEMETANPNASADAKSILNYLAHLPEREDSGRFVI